MKNSKLHFLPVDWAVMGYMAVTLAYMLYGAQKLNHVLNHIEVRLLMALLIVAFARFDVAKAGQNKVFYFLRNFYPLLILSYFYKETGYLNNIVFNYFDGYFVYLEKALWGMQPSIEFSKHFPQKWFSELMNFSYFFYYFLTLGIGLLAYFWNKTRLQKIIFMVAVSFLIYYLIFAFFPVKGPQFWFYGADAKPVDSYFFSKMVKLAQHIGETQTGAFPSSHVGMSVIFLILTYKYLRKTFWVILIPVVLLWFATVYIKAHYLIDVIGGFITAPLIYWVSDKMYKMTCREIN